MRTAIQRVEFRPWDRQILFQVPNYNCMIFGAPECDRIDDERTAERSGCLRSPLRPLCSGRPRRQWTRCFGYSARKNKVPQRELENRRTLDVLNLRRVRWGYGRLGRGEKVPMRRAQISSLTLQPVRASRL